MAPAAIALAAVLWLAAAGLGAQGQAPGSPRDFAARVQQKYETIRDFSASFTQMYQGGVLRKKTTERGTVQVKKPGRMRWAYTAPEEKLFVSDGVKLYSWVPADRQVIVRSVPQADQATSPVLFLAGKGNLARDFDASFVAVPGSPPNAVALKLVPRQKANEYDWLTLVVDRDTLTLRMLVAGDSQGGTSTFTFTDLKENVGLPDKTFSFAIPRGADVITQG